MVSSPRVTHPGRFATEPAVGGGISNCFSSCGIVPLVMNTLGLSCIYFCVDYALMGRASVPIAS
jgi:hypothetical protein